MNYLLLLGVFLFSSASGALAVVLLHMSRTDQPRGVTQRKADRRLFEEGTE